MGYDRIAMQVHQAFGIEAELIAGSGGIFDVVVDGELRYSKHESGSFPDEVELIRQLGDN